MTGMVVLRHRARAPSTLKFKMSGEVVRRLPKGYSRADLLHERSFTQAHSPKCRASSVQMVASA
jgi:hypothetical protein